MCVLWTWVRTSVLCCAVLCGSSVVGVTGDCGSSWGLFCSGVVGWAFSLALLCALVDIKFKNTTFFGTFCFQSELVYHKYLKTPVPVLKTGHVD